MRLTSLITLLLLLSQVPVLGQQQNQISAEVSVSADIIQSIELITVNSMQFQNVQPGQQELYINPVNDLNAGYMIAVGTPEAEFRLSYLPEREITQIDGDNTLTFMYEISGNTEEDQSTSELLENENQNVQFNSEGRYYFWIGGRINLENAAPGNYEGDFTIEIDYI
ncbi:DUF4402 domain-containing protein [Gracilimonas mengyeensis]|uniref:DUF4402 domain-containing protein n=1 Tax=Gracilimonas mengyeensis TaxID=1302730 RepID=A0A521EDS2_9BACT|nr:DUF4402 domain-containing protein [Gracilimonas mengyeensis]SMO82086.1 protein of unknown function [Gracilimonas mengyeensis]